MKTVEQTLFEMLETPGDTREIKPVVDVANNKLYYQTAPFVRDGKIVIKRVAEYDIEIEKVYQLVEEYSTDTSEQKDSK